MMELEKIPQAIADMVGGTSYYLDNIGRSDSKVLLFEDRVLKIEKITKNNNIIISKCLDIDRILSRRQFFGKKRKSQL